ncbi:MAG: sigma-54-dependent Fis family transcriptional regulator [Proteobacteria bacterium]|nr:sigma-54-dependent Fis family transcriptional regulator [Pseudomonadota bacterium]
MQHDMRSILVVDDEADMRLAIKTALVRKGYSVETASDGLEALQKLKLGEYAMVISDMAMPGLDGLGLLKEIKRRSAHIPVLLITAYGTIERAVEAVKEGAEDFILKPFDLDLLESMVERALKLQQECMSFETRGKNMLTIDPMMRKTVSMSMTAASCDATVLVSGESGTGKELIARFIHERSSRSEGPFVAVNCASIPDGLLESELFGHEKGSFTGATAQRQGKFEQADNGTILLDEISEMDLKLQAKLLRVLQEHEVERLGGKVPIELNIRVIATTNRNLKEDVKEGRFREDLFYRLNIFPLRLPPLRERKGDVEFLANHFTTLYARKYAKHLEGISPSAMESLKTREWRGNIRELENCIERAVLLSTGKLLVPEYLLDSEDESAEASEVEETSATIGGRGGNGVKKVDTETVNNMTLAEMEKGLIIKTLDTVEWNRTRAAGILGISVRTLRNKLKEYGTILPG